MLIQRAQVLRYHIAPERVDHQLRRLDDSRARSREQLLEIQARVAERRPELASLFDAQLLMLDDPMLVPRAADIVREQRVNAEWAVQQVFHEFSAVFEEVADHVSSLRERKGDVGDLVGRLRMNLRQGVATPRDLLRELDESSVLIADELTPSIAAQVDWSKVRGVRDRRRQPHVSHRDSRPLARSPRGRRPAQRQRAGAGRAARRDRRHGE